MMIKESEVGMVASYRFRTEQFDVSKIAFNIKVIPFPDSEDMKLINSISYDGEGIPLYRSDTLVSGNTVYFR